MGGDIYLQRFEDGDAAPADALLLAGLIAPYADAPGPDPSPEVQRLYFDMVKRSTDTALCGILSGCEMLNAAGKQCLLPYPSSLFLHDDPTTATGERLAYPRRGMPSNAAGVHVNPVKWDSLDGFSPGTIGMAVFPQGVDLLLSNAPSLLNYAASIDPASPTVLLDADTGERIEHFAFPAMNRDYHPMVIPVDAVLRKLLDHLLQNIPQSILSFSHVLIPESFEDVLLD